MPPGRAGGPLGGAVRPPTLGAVADDVTGGTDLASALVRAGLRTVQTLGLPQGPAAALTGGDEVDALVVALKTRTAPVEQAVKESRAAARWLLDAGCRQLYEKYCSTFDSTPAGNIGPITDALLEETGSDLTVVCPAFPATGRTVYRSHLFVGDQLLSDSGMGSHPLTPMTDSDLRRLLQAQTLSRVGALTIDVVRAGAGAVRAGLARLRADGVRMVVVDAIDDADLDVLAEATRDLALLTGGSGLGQGLRQHVRAPGLPDTAGPSAASALPEVDGAQAVLAGSCSLATLAQLEHVRDRYPAWQLDPRTLADDLDGVLDAVAAWAVPQLGDGPVVIAASAGSEQVREAQDALGTEAAGALVERALAEVGRRLVAAGVHRLAVCGGESAGAVTAALGVQALRIGASIDPGVPWTAGRTSDGTLLHLALKSGNFGGTDFLERCWRSPT